MRTAVADVISIDKKLLLSKEKEAALTRKRKIQAVQKVFHCTHCASKCEKCGIQIGLESHVEQRKPRKYRIPYHFCDSCEEEYVDYIERLQGRGDPECYWHNEAWLAIWRTWIDYQHSVDRYMKSKEFLQILEELKQPEPDQ